MGIFKLYFILIKNFIYVIYLVELINLYSKLK